MYTNLFPTELSGKLPKAAMREQGTTRGSTANTATGATRSASSAAGSLIRTAMVACGATLLMIPVAVDAMVVDVPLREASPPASAVASELRTRAAEGAVMADDLMERPTDVDVATLVGASDVARLTPGAVAQIAALIEHPSSAPAALRQLMRDGR